MLKGKRAGTLHFQVLPVGAGLRVHHEGYLQFRNAGHPIAHQVDHIHLARGNLEEQLVMNLQDHPGLELPLPKLVGDPDHS